MAKRKSKSDNAKRKAKFRASPEWKEFRKWKMENQGLIDPITGSKLPPRFHLHHKDLSVENYEDLSNEDNYIGLQPTTHKVIHWCLVQIKKCHSMEVIDRLYRELEAEADLNGLIKITKNN